MPESFKALSMSLKFLFSNVFAFHRPSIDGELPHHIPAFFDRSIAEIIFLASARLRSIFVQSDGLLRSYPYCSTLDYRLTSAAIGSRSADANSLSRQLSPAECCDDIATQGSANQHASNSPAESILAQRSRGDDSLNASHSTCRCRHDPGTGSNECQRSPVLRANEPIGGQKRARLNQPRCNDNDHDPTEVNADCQANRHNRRYDQQASQRELHWCRRPRVVRDRLRRIRFGVLHGIVAVQINPAIVLIPIGSRQVNGSP